MKAITPVSPLFLTGGLIDWAALISREPDAAVIVVGAVLTGVGVGLTFPTLMGISTASLPTSSFAWIMAGVSRGESHGGPWGLA